MSQIHANPDPESPPSTPRWLKVFGLIILAVVLLFVILVFTGIGGEYGHGRHIPTPISIIEMKQP